ncbi:hypothetical protein [Streptomyces sp. CBMA29]|uniref:hypothetical protein n=1 Tax=Streptomyces sp. CBMA29 TaxID=1896314 RepID=UPI0016621863|nr:hypothetical protein [Streptomyces sp. CBMA29]MBD0737890.1 hypothetical protein [Streptomyces sp. CBMA29]
MQQSRTTGTRTRTVRRIALTTAALALAVAVPAAAAQAQSQPRTVGHPHGHAAAHKAHTSEPVIGSGSPQSTTGRVADFYGSYIDAVSDHDSRLGADLRSHFLTKGLQKKLAAWEKKNHADGVLRAQNVPTAWRVTYAGSGAGHAFTNVRLTFGGKGHETYRTLKVQSDLATKKISDIK